MRSVDSSPQSGGFDSPGGVTRRDALKRLGVIGLGLATANSTLGGCNPPSTPNVLLIIADDLRYDHLPFMPNVQSMIADHGVTFTQGRCNVPLCQPSRIGLMTGQMSKHNNDIDVGFGPPAFQDHGSALGNWVHSAGYRCALIGKYINYFDGTGGINAPAGYGTWRELISEASAYEFGVHLRNSTTTIVGQYPTDYIAQQATTFMALGGAFLCIVTPHQPHAPFRPRDDLADMWSDVEWPIVDEVDVSDKPSWIQALTPLTNGDKATIRENVRGALREISAVDDMVSRMITQMAPAVLANTVIIFTSDNGVHHGEHRRRGAATKAGPYEVGLHVPLLVRGPGFFPGSVVTTPVLTFQDIAATIIKLTGATAGLTGQAGISLADIATDPAAYRERILLHEIGQGFHGQTGDGITTGPESSFGFRKLFRYPSVRSNPAGPFVYEAYDLDSDADELSSWANDAGRLEERNALEAELLALRL